MSCAGSHRMRCFVIGTRCEGTIAQNVGGPEMAEFTFQEIRGFGEKQAEPQNQERTAA